MTNSQALGIYLTIGLVFSALMLFVENDPDDIEAQTMVDLIKNDPFYYSFSLFMFTVLWLPLIGYSIIASKENG